MLRVHTERDGKGGMVLRLEGSLIGPWIAELARVLEAVPEGALVLDLAALVYADKRGEQLLRDLAARAEVRACSPFLAELLRGSKEP